MSRCVRIGALACTVALAALSACGDDMSTTMPVPTSVDTTSTAAPSTPQPTASATPLAESPITTTPTPTIATHMPTPTVSLTPIDVARFTGVYDCSSTTNGRFAADQVASVSADEGAVTIAVTFDGHSHMSLTGGAHADGSVDLEGFGIYQDDIAFDAVGTAQLAATVESQRITGAFHDRNGSFLEGTFTLERSAAGTRPVFSGSYAFTFMPSPSGCACVSTATIVIDSPVSGFGRSLEAEELDENGMHLGVFDAGDCAITPSGRLGCFLRYVTTFPQPPDGIPAGAAVPVVLLGRLTAGEGHVSGSGRTDVPTFPPVFQGGTWTATR